MIERIFIIMTVMLLAAQLVHSSNEDIEVLLNAGKGSDALELITERLQSDSSHDLMFLHARGLLQLNKMEEGKNMLKHLQQETTRGMKLTDVNPTSVAQKAEILLGRVALGEKNFQEARVHLQRALSVDPQNPQALAGMGKIALVSDDSAESALGWLRRAEVVAPNDVTVLFDLGMVLFYNNMLDEGKEALDRARKLHPNMDLMVIGRVYCHYRKWAWAEEVLLAALGNADESGNGIDSNLLLLLAETEDMLSKPDVAAYLYQLLLNEHPENALANMGLGLLKLGISSRNYGSTNACGVNQESAIRHLRTAASTDPKLANLAVQALKFCSEEIGEVKFWRSKLGLGEDGKAGGETAKAVNRGKVTGGVHGAIRTVQSLMHKVLGGALRVSRLCEPSSPVHAMPLVRHLCASMGGHAQSAGSASKSPRTTLNAAMVPGTRAEIEKMQNQWDARALRMKSVPEVKSAPTQEQILQFMYANKPLVIRDGAFQKGWGEYKLEGKEGSSPPTAVQNDAFQNDKLESFFGASMVRVSISETGRFDGPESGELWDLGSRTDVLVRPPQTSMLLADYLTLALGHAPLTDTNGQPLSETFYLEYLALHQYLGPKFAALIPMPEALASANGTLEHLVTNLWAGSKPTTSPLHYDDYENMLCQIRGRKEIILFPPEDLTKLYYQGRPKGKLAYEYPSHFIRDPDSVDKRGFVFGSGVNVDRPDLERHPLYTDAQPVRVVLEPGDVLYLPAYWHHEVQSIPDNNALNLAVNFWFANLTAPIDDIGLLNVALQ
jgi:tetratricopeptide (TPR) repeat protein